MTPKPSKPNTLYYPPRNGHYETKVKLHDDIEYPVQINQNLMSLDEAKIIYDWLGQAIAYLESREK